jgi:hypothetical protein
MENKPTKEGGKRLAEYLDLKLSSGVVWVGEDTYIVQVHNTYSRWIFSGALVDTWEGCAVEYNLNAKKLPATAA